MKSPLADLNPGDRPSRLDVARLHTGEITGPEADALRERILRSPQASAWLAELEDARANPPPFDEEILRKAAVRLGEDEKRGSEAQEAASRPAPRRAWWKWGVPSFAFLAAAAAVTVAVLPGPTVRTKGEGDLEFYVLRDGEVYPGTEDEVHVAGDRIQFTYRSDGESTLVLVSVDGNGKFNVYYPAYGDEPVTIWPGVRKVLPGSIELDDAPDFEVFLAFFGADSVDDVVGQVEDLYERDGLDGVLRLAEAEPDVDAIFIHKSPSSDRP